MSRSPEAERSKTARDAYVAGWHAVMALLREGRSFSGRERNLAYLGCGGRRFADVSAVTGLDFADDGRALAVVDWDGDGDLDLWLHNRTGPRLRLMRNNARERVPENGYVAFRLRGTRANRDGVGARVVVALADGRALVETLYAGDAYLSQSSKWLHFGLGRKGLGQKGLGRSASIERVTVRWPGGGRETFAGARPGGRYLLVEGDGVATPVAPRTADVALAADGGGSVGRPRPDAPASGDSPAATTTAERLFLHRRLPLPELRYASFDGGRPGREEAVRRSGSSQPAAGGDEALRSAGAGRPAGGVADRRVATDDGPLLLNLWATWCIPCRGELEELTARAGELRAAGLEVLALSVDGLDPAQGTDAGDAERYLDQLGFPFAGGLAGAELLDKIELLETSLYDRRLPLGIPTSFLIDREGRLAATYRGRVDVALLLADVAALDGSVEELHRRSAALPGRWQAPLPELDLAAVARTFRPRYPEDAERYLEHALARHEELRAGDLDQRALRELDRHQSRVLLELAQASLARGRPEESIARLRRALKLRPDLALAHANLAQLLRAAGRPAEAAHHYRRALATDADDAEARFGLGMALLDGGDVEGAFRQLQQAAATSPDSPAPLHAMAWILIQFTDRSDPRPVADAIRFAESGVELTARQDPLLLDVLAAAYAHAGRYPEAVATARHALDLARAQNQSDLATQIAARLAAFERGQPAPGGTMR